MLKRKKIYSQFNDEELLVSPRLHPINWLTPIVLACCAFYFREAAHVIHIFYLGYLAMTFLVLYTTLRLMLATMLCTSRRIISITGVIFTRTEEMRVDRIDSIRVDQSLLGRILGYGSVSFISNNSIIKFKRIIHPWVLKIRIESFFSG